MRLTSRLLAFLSVCLVLYAGLAPALEGCGPRGHPAPGPHAGMPAMPGQDGHSGSGAGAAWTASHQAAASHLECCPLMATCSTLSWLGTAPRTGPAALEDAAVGPRAAPELASLLTAPETPPPRV